MGYYRYIFIIVLFAFQYQAKAQDFTLSQSQAETAASQAADLLESYEMSLNNLGDPLTTVQEKNYFLTDIISNIFESEDVLIYNDLDPEDLESKDLTARVYLNNIITKYNKGLRFIFSDVKISEPFYLDENSFFVKIELASNLDGIHIEQPINTFEALDFYLKYTIDELYNIAPPKIYSITNHRENLDQFSPVTIDQGPNLFNFSFINPSKGVKFRRGKEYRITWKGNPREIPVGLELYLDKKLVYTINPVIIGNQFSWNIPSDIKLGKGYQIKITNLKNKDNSEYSSVFSIKRKVPLGLKIAGIAALGGAVWYVVTEEPFSSENSEAVLLPEPPGVPEQ